MKRREFIGLIGGAAAAWPLAARAQQQAMPVIGILSSGSTTGFASRQGAFRQGLIETGYVEGQNVAFEYRGAEGQIDRLPELAADLVRRQVSVIVTDGPSAQSAKAATTTIPIVFMMGSNPVETGLVASLSRPGGNLTGVVNLGVELNPKRLELLHELVPNATVFGALIDPNNATSVENQSRNFLAAASTLGLQLHIFQASSERDFETAFANLVQLKAGGLVIGGDALFTNESEQLGALALRHSLPAIYQQREFASAGGLMSYGGDFTDRDRQAGIYTGRILKGEKPANLPVQQIAKFEMIINLKTAKALGLTVPQTLLVAADEVIE